jgi:Na+/melibiose symporter-like transporter
MNRKPQKSIGLRQLFEDMALFLTVCTAILFITVFNLANDFQYLIFIMICVSAAMFCIGKLMRYDTKKEEKLKKGIDSFVAWRNSVRSKVNR